ncbi:MAG: hypothetical protein L3J38_04780 [Thiomicrorhabdus sp.]|nr:hypothetical protein [Thiomicrorhabdus sp.]
MAKVDGILLATVNFTNKRIRIRWDNSQLKLSDIIKKLNSIGYDATPYDASASEEATRKANRDLLYRLGFAGFAMMNVTWFRWLFILAPVMMKNLKSIFIGYN